MEPGMILLTMIAVVGGVHLLDCTANFFNKKRTAKGPNKEGTRSDWYCFFNPAELYGVQVDERIKTTYEFRAGAMLQSNNMPDDSEQTPQPDFLPGLQQSS